MAASWFDKLTMSPQIEFTQESRGLVFGAGPYSGPMSAMPFLKMHGLGNDFVVLDARAHALALRRGSRDGASPTGAPASAATSSSSSSRRATSRADAFMRDPQRRRRRGRGLRQRRALRRRSADAGERGSDTRRHRDEAGAARRREAAGRRPRQRRHGRAGGLDWREIPLAEAWTRAPRCCALGPAARSGRVNMGNPHVGVLRAAMSTPSTIGDAGAGARAPSAVSRARQYRRRADPGRATDPRCGCGSAASA